LSEKNEHDIEWYLWVYGVKENVRERMLAWGTRLKVNGSGFFLAPYALRLTPFLRSISLDADAIFPRTGVQL